MRPQRAPTSGMALGYVGVGVLLTVVSLMLLLLGTDHVLLWLGLGAGVAALVVGAAQWSSARHPQG
ncbi:hypothetical protein [Ornithinimicrobium panacihumi]|uniref:hypothetical protein n=1 Tax=Ornithinimicrobium panacihumi TaxID=2008449 RepID=UPI003F8B6610